MQNDQNQPMNPNPMPQDQPMNDDQGGAGQPMPANPTPEPMPEGGEEEKHEDPSMPAQGGNQQV